MKKHILDFKENECIHVSTLEEAEWLFGEFRKLGIRWASGDETDESNTKWSMYEGSTFYYPNRYKFDTGQLVYTCEPNEGSIIFKLNEIEGFPRNLIRPLEALIEFQTAFKCPVNTEPTLLDKERAKLRYDLAKEELDEYMEAVENGDIVGITDAIIDQAYILFGSVLEHGLQDIFMKAFEEVHKSNLSKLDENGQPIINGENGVYDESRPLKKVLKSDRYFPPNLKQFL